jgi:hypothetical protein
MNSAECTTCGVLAVFFLSGCRGPIYQQTGKKVSPDGEKGGWPKTLKEADNQILNERSLEDEEKVRLIKKENLILFHHGWGTGIRNDFGLWRGNSALLNDCQATHPDDDSMVIIEAVWESLNNTSDLRK